MNYSTIIESPAPVLLTALPATERDASSAGAILSIGSPEADHHALEQIFKLSRWTLQRAHTVPAAMALLAKNRTEIVLCEQKLADGTWRYILDCVTALPQAPFVIVTSHLADERLWAEALEAGAYDVLAKPFQAVEVIRVVRLAFRDWHDLHPGGVASTLTRIPGPRRHQRQLSTSELRA